MVSDKADRADLRSGPHDHTNALACIAMQLLLEHRSDPIFRRIALEHEVAACDIGFHLHESGVGANLRQLSHRQLGGAADIRGAKQGYISGRLRAPLSSHRCHDTTRFTLPRTTSFWTTEVEVSGRQAAFRLHFTQTDLFQASIRSA